MSTRWIALVVLLLWSLVGCQRPIVEGTETAASTPQTTTQSSESVPTNAPSTTPSLIPVTIPLPVWEPTDVEGFSEALVARLLEVAQTAGAKTTLDPQNDVRMITPEKVYSCSALQGGEEDKRFVGNDYSERPAAFWCGSDNSWEIYIHELALHDVEGLVTGGAQFAIIAAVGDYILDANGKSDASTACGAGFLAGALEQQANISTAQLHAWRNLLPSADQPFYDNGVTNGLTAC